jgi:NAD(P)-dependent dehydrogenase (short-subunit alcohol dehydrogenase family)
MTGQHARSAGQNTASRFRAPQDREQLYKDTAAAVPLGRVGEVTDIAQAYLYYLTESFATGSVLTLDGGTVLA